MENCVEGVLYTVATPIGNISDITLRAIETLKNVDLILAEDTRNTSFLLKKYDIETKLKSYHKFNEIETSNSIINLLKQGQNIALVTDAGTPLISDPGNILVKEAIKNNIKIVPIVGACALVALIQSVYRDDEDFKFIGFLPKNKNQIIEIITKNRFENLIFYESPKRILETLKIISAQNPDKNLALGRELTKKFEQINVFNIKDAINHYEKREIKGEFVIMLLKDKQRDEINLDDKIKKLKELNYSNKDISMILASLFEVNKNEIYKKCLTFI